MHIEMKNLDSGKSYYLCYSGEDIAGIIYNPDIRNHLTTLDVKMSVKDMFNIIRPVVDRLNELDPGRYQINAFRFTDTPVTSLTEVRLVTSYGMWVTGDPVYIDGKLRSTKFVAL